MFLKYMGQQPFFSNPSSHFTEADRCLRHDNYWQRCSRLLRRETPAAVFTGGRRKHSPLFQGAQLSSPDPAGRTVHISPAGGEQLLRAWGKCLGIAKGNVQKMQSASQGSQKGCGRRRRGGGKISVLVVSSHCLPSYQGTFSSILLTTLPLHDMFLQLPEQFLI